MVGSRDSIAGPNVVLNTIVAEAFAEACDVLEKADDFDTAVHSLIKEYLTDHQRIIFNGNGYSDEWVAEAEKRGLPNIKSMVDAIPAYTAPESVAAFEKFGVFTKYVERDSFTVREPGMGPFLTKHHIDERLLLTPEGFRIECRHYNCFNELANDERTVVCTRSIVC